MKPRVKVSSNLTYHTVNRIRFHLYVEGSNLLSSVGTKNPAGGSPIATRWINPCSTDGIPECFLWLGIVIEEWESTLINFNCNCCWLLYYNIYCNITIYLNHLISIYMFLISATLLNILVVCWWAFPHAGHLRPLALKI